MPQEDRERQKVMGKEMNPLRRWRGKTSRRAIAEQIGVTEMTVYQWERGAFSPNLASMERLCDVMGVKDVIRFATRWRKWRASL